MMGVNHMMNGISPLSDRIRSVRPVKALIGFDGFIDEIVHVVDIRTDSETFTRIDSMESYAARIHSGCNLSTNLEIVVATKKLGGNGPILANALKKQSMDITYIGSVGKDAIDPIFSDLAEGSHMIGLADPSHTDSYEFHDGKVIVSKLQPFGEITWDRIVEVVGRERFVDILDDNTLIGMENWTMLPHMSDIWTQLLDEVVPAMKTSAAGKTLFFDLADPEKRKTEDIRAALDLIGRFTKAGFRTVLGLNKKEALEIANICTDVSPGDGDLPLRPLTEELYRALSLDIIVIHPVDRACSMSRDGYECVEGPYLERPVLTTGAGDNFNAGYVTGLMNGFSLEECLLCGVYTSGYYVRKANSPDLSELSGFMKAHGI
jgi:sugar/nucleoside kinase (ribokinase family)